MIPGEYFLKPEPIEINAGSSPITLVVVNTGDRPVQVGSHFHFFEANKQLLFNRKLALGKRLNIAAGTAVRFEPGEQKKVVLIKVGGLQKIMGFNNLVNGEVQDEAVVKKALEKMQAAQFKNINE